MTQIKQINTDKISEDQNHLRHQRFINLSRRWLSIKMTSFQKMSSLTVLSPFVDEGGLGKFYQLFGVEAENIIEEINKE